MCMQSSDGYVNVWKMEATSARLVNVGYHKVTTMHVLRCDHDNKDGGQMCIAVIEDRWSQSTCEVPTVYQISIALHSAYSITDKSGRDQTSPTWHRLMIHDIPIAKSCFGGRSAPDSWRFPVAASFSQPSFSC
jgi:hypothetical protein